jgi:hypothetical protein
MANFLGLNQIEVLKLIEAGPGVIAIEYGRMIRMRRRPGQRVEAKMSTTLRLSSAWH